jgi:ABC-type multidrug transport system fused ATPase/permease subunit
LQVEPGAHIGIVGRTGSGKSSLFLAFFRMVEPESGAVVIDGKDTKDMGLRTVRRGLSMIPQVQSISLRV